jgi:hypothetical protein
MDKDENNAGVWQSNMDSIALNDPQPLNINPNRITVPDIARIPSKKQIFEDKERTDSTKKIEKGKQEIDEYKK